MTSIQTLKVVDHRTDLGYQIINQEDFDPTRHQRFEPAPFELPKTPKTLAQLKARAKALGIKEPQKATKSQLLCLIQDAQSS